MRERMGVLRRVLANPGLRRVEPAFLAFGAAEYGVWVAVLVYAYQRGGTTMSAAVAVLQLIPAAIVAPLAARLADRRGGAVALRIGYVIQALAVGFSAAAMLSHAPPAVVYVGAVIAASAVTLTRPAQGALLPALVDTPKELTAANVACGWVESVSLLIGPALAGGLIALDGPGAALAVFAIAMSGAAVLVAPLAASAGEPPAAIEDQPAAPLPSVIGVLRRGQGVVAVLSVIATEFVALGALDVLEVVLALKLLRLGPGGAGYLGAAFGAGAILGAAGAVALVGRHRLLAALLGAALAWGAAFLALGAWPTVGLAFGLLAGAGAGRTVLDVSGRTMLHRAVPAQLHGRVFGVLEGIAMLGLAVGSLSVPVLVDLAGPRSALIAVGALLVAVPLITVGTLRAVERGAPSLDFELALLRGSPLFSMLSAPVLEDLARALVRRPVSAGATVIREGERGDRFYLLATGELTVTAGARRIRTLSPGEGFGEIALLRDGVRTATVTAQGPATLYALERAPFLEAVTGSYHAYRAANELIAARLGSESQRAESPQ